MQNRLQKTPRRRPAPATLLVDVKIIAAFIVAGVGIATLGNADFFSGFNDRVQYLPAHPGRFHAELAVTAMMLAVAQEVTVQLAEHGLHIIPAPAGQAQLPPMIIVLRLAAHRKHRIDGRRSANRLAARIIQPAAIQAGVGLGLEHPVAARIADQEQITDRDVKPYPVVMPAGFQQQHALPGIGRQPIGQHAAGRTRAHHDIVIVAVKIHRAIPSRYTRTALPANMARRSASLNPSRISV